eukprot:6186282-Pleurochrysis_carterae.AAC.2
MSLWSFGSGGHCLGHSVPAADNEKAARERSRPVVDGALSSTVPRLLHLVKLSKIACGGSHCLGVSEHGRVFSWGWNAYGQLGDGTLKDRSKPSLIPALIGHAVGAIACGAGHSAALVTCDDAEGLRVECFTWGAHQAGQLARDAPVRADGTLTEEFQPASPRAVYELHKLPLKGAITDSPRKVTVDPSKSACESVLPGIEGAGGLLACGAAHTALLTSSGQLITWGANQHGQCGQQRAGSIASPNIVRFLAAESLVAVACGGAHTMMLCEDGRVFACGLNATGQLGDGLCVESGCHSLPQPVRLPATTTAVQIACGEEFSAALTAEGRLYTWGFGGCGQLGHGSCRSIKLPREVDCEPMRSVSCGGNHMLAITQADGLLRWGYEGSWQQMQKLIAKLQAEQKQFMPTVEESLTFTRPRAVDMQVPSTDGSAVSYTHLRAHETDSYL